MAEVQITDAEHAKIVDLHNKGVNFYDIAKTVFKFETEETVQAVGVEVAKAEDAGEFIKEEPKKAAK